MLPLICEGIKVLLTMHFSYFIYSLLGAFATGFVVGLIVKFKRRKKKKNKGEN